MKSGVPVLGVVPNLLPQWLNEENGFWINNKIQTVDFIADILQNWLEDNLKPELYENIKKTVESLPTKESFNKNVLDLFEEYFKIRIESFEEQLNKLQETVEE
jgi:hypothetical protein